MKNQTISKHKQSISEITRSKANYRLPITINNKSSIGFMKAEIAVKDEGSASSGDETVVTAYFGSIPKGESRTEYVNLPGGIEFAI